MSEWAVAVATLPTTPINAALRISAPGLIRRNSTPPTRLKTAIEPVSNPKTIPP